MSVSEEDVVFEIIAQPTISSSNNVLECESILASYDYRWGKLRHNGQKQMMMETHEIKPTVKYGEIYLQNDILHKRNDLLGPFGGQTCAEITFDLPKMH